MIEPSCKMSVEDVATHYNDLDRYYREVWGEHLHHGLWTDGKESPEQAVQELVRLLANQAKIGPGDQVCDVGCGYGATARQLVDEYEAQVLGVTVSESQLEYALGQSGAPDEKLHGQARDVNSPSSSSPPAGESPNPRYRLQNWESNDFENRSFDAVVSIECLAHVVDKQKYFSEIFRVLKPGKHAAITAWLSGEDPTDWHVRHLLEPICREGRLASMGTAREYEKMISAAGLELVKSESLRSHVRRTWDICARRAVIGLFTRPEFRELLIRRSTSNWIFFVTLWRIILAYRLRVMDYGLFVIRRPVGPN